MIPVMLFEFNCAVVDDKTGTSGEILTHPSNVVVFVNQSGHATRQVLYRLNKTSRWLCW
jgi:hypothetical protein